MADSNIIGSDNPLTETQRSVLNVVLDMIVPASADGRMPSAADVDVLAYIRESEGESLPDLKRELDRLEDGALSNLGKAFVDLKPMDRQGLVDELRRAEPRFLAALAMQTVTSYYLDDRVMEALGLEPRPPFPEGYEVERGDLSLLDPVRERGKLFRDAP